MAQTTAAAVLKLVRTLNTGLNVWLDKPPDGTKRPYITVTPGVLAPGRLEDGGPGTAIEPVHIDVYQDWKSADNSAVVWDPLVAAKIQHGLHGAGVLAGDRVLFNSPGGAGVIYRLKLVSSNRLEDQTVENLMRDEIVVNAWRQF
jgi:hypothetical protein